MKIKTDFVSNSSSTSFIYISKEELTKERFFDAAGVELDSPLSNMFDDLYHAINDAIVNGTEVNREEELPSEDKYPEFSRETIERAKEALSKGHNVVIGGLSSDAELPESFLCVESFEIESSELLISAYSNYW